jgi:hypothetical protein
VIPFSAQAIANLENIERKHYYIHTYPKCLVVIGDLFQEMRSRKIVPEPCCTVGGFIMQMEKDTPELEGGPYIAYPWIAFVECPTLVEARAEAAPETKAAVTLIFMGNPVKEPWVS